MSSDVSDEGLTCAFGMSPVPRHTHVGGRRRKRCSRTRNAWVVQRPRCDPLGVSGWRPVTVARTDGSAVEQVAALPWWPVVGLVGHDHALPAVAVQFADPLDDAAFPPPAANSGPHGGVARAGAPLLPGDAVGGSGGRRECSPAMLTAHVLRHSFARLPPLLRLDVWDGIWEQTRSFQITRVEVITVWITVRLEKCARVGEETMPMISRH